MSYEGCGEYTPSPKSGKFYISDDPNGERFFIDGSRAPREEFLRRRETECRHVPDYYKNHCKNCSTALNKTDKGAPVTSIICQCTTGSGGHISGNTVYCNHCDKPFAWSAQTLRAQYVTDAGEVHNVYCGLPKPRIEIVLRGTGDFKDFHYDLILKTNGNEMNLGPIQEMHIVGRHTSFTLRQGGSFSINDPWTIEKHYPK